MKIVNFSISKPVTVSVVAVGVLIFGLVSYQRLALNLMPDLTYPSATVRTEYPGAAPEEIEQMISRPLEEALGVLGGLVELSSISRAGLSDVVLEFEWDTDMQSAMIDIREKIDRVPLPEDAGRPLILRYDPSSDPVLELGLAGTGKAIHELRRFARVAAKKEIEAVSGVAAVKVRGGYEEEIVIEVDEARLARLGVTFAQLELRLAEENLNIAGGSLLEGSSEYMLRSLNKFTELGDLEKLVIATPDGRTVCLGDLASVSRKPGEQTTLTRIDGSESVELEVHKEAGENTVALVKRVLTRLGLFTPRSTGSFRFGGKEETQRNEGLLQLPEGVSWTVISDQSVFISNSISEVLRAAMLGGLFAIFVLYLFLRRLSATVIIATAIPLSIVAAFNLMYFKGISLNVMSLGGLALGIGMLVDNAIVVLESISRCLEEGDDPLAAAERGTSEVGNAIIASTLTTVAVFLPVAFVQGVAGQLFADQAFTVTFSLIASLAVALTVIPMLASRVGGSKKKVQGDAGPSERIWLSEALARRKDESGGFFKSLFTDLGRRCRSRLKNELRMRREPPGTGWRHIPIWLFFLPLRLTKLALLVLVFILENLSFALLRPPALFFISVSKRTGSERNRKNSRFDSFRNRYTGIIRAALRNKTKVLLATVLLLAGGLFLLPRIGMELIPELRQGEFSIDLALPVGTSLQVTADAVENLENYVSSLDGVETVFLAIGANEETGEGGDSAGEHFARLTVRLTDISSEETVLDQVLEYEKRLAGMEKKISRPVLFSFRQPLEIEVRGNDLAALKQVGGMVASCITDIPGIHNVKTSLRAGYPEIHVKFDRERLAAAGLNVQDASAEIRSRLLGGVPTRYSTGERAVDMRVRAEPRKLRTTQDLTALTITIADGTPIPLRALAEFETAEGPSEIRRRGQERVALVSASTTGLDLGGAASLVEKRLRELRMPAGVRTVIAGQVREMEAATRSMTGAILMALFLVFLVMASQFESFLYPLVILFTFPLALLGAVVVLYVFGIPISVVVLIGLIVLAGIVVNNGIVLVDYTNKLRERGVPLDDAVVEAARVRLRPVLMTTATTVLGLLPMALSFGAGAEIRIPLAVTVIGGLLSSTFLTLILVPVLYRTLSGGRQA